MRDLIWTIIVIWLVWKIIAAFKSNTKQQPSNANSNFDGHTREGEVKIDNFNKNGRQSKYNPSDAEFVDYEEVK